MRGSVPVLHHTPLWQAQRHLYYNLLELIEQNNTPLL